MSKTPQMPSGGGSYVRKKNGQLEKVTPPAPPTKPDEEEKSDVS